MRVAVTYAVTYYRRDKCIYVIRLNSCRNLICHGANVNVESEAFFVQNDLKGKVQKLPPFHWKICVHAVKACSSRLIYQTYIAQSFEKSRLLQIYFLLLRKRKK